MNEETYVYVSVLISRTYFEPAFSRIQPWLMGPRRVEPEGVIWTNGATHVPRAVDSIYTLPSDGLVTIFQLAAGLYSYRVANNDRPPGIVIVGAGVLRPLLPLFFFFFFYFFFFFFFLSFVFLFFFLSLPFSLLCLTLEAE